MYCEIVLIGSAQLRHRKRRNVTLEISKLCHPAVRVTEAWRRGEIGNFEYLLYLNFAAGRSLNDLTQWCGRAKLSHNLSDPCAAS